MSVGTLGPDLLFTMQISVCVTQVMQQWVIQPVRISDSYFISVKCNGNAINHSGIKYFT